MDKKKRMLSDEEKGVVERQIGRLLKARHRQEFLIKNADFTLSEVLKNNYEEMFDTYKEKKRDAHQAVTEIDMNIFNLRKQIREGV